MRVSLLVVTLAAAASACGGKSADGPGGAAGTSSGGSGGSAGTSATSGSGGSGGSGGSAGSAGGSSGGPGGASTGGTGGPPITGVSGHGGSPYPACGGGTASTLVDGEIIGGDGMDLLASVTATVTVSTLESAPGGSGFRVVLSDVASSARWTWAATIPDLPVNLISPGDQLDLTVDARACQIPLTSLPCQTVALARNGALLVFTAALWGLRDPPLPALGPWGVSTSDTTVVCSTSDQFCEHRSHAMQITMGTETATLPPGHSIALGSVTFALGTFDEPVDHGNCDAGGRTLLAGFRQPPSGTGGAGGTTGSGGTAGTGGAGGTTGRGGSGG